MKVGKVLPGGNGRILQPKYFQSYVRLNLFPSVHGTCHLKISFGSRIVQSTISYFILDQLKEVQVHALLGFSELLL